MWALVVLSGGCLEVSGDARRYGLSLCQLVLYDDVGVGLSSPPEQSESPTQPLLLLGGWLIGELPSKCESLAGCLHPLLPLVANLVVKLSYQEPHQVSTPAGDFLRASLPR